MLKLNSSKEVFQWYTVNDEVYSTNNLTELAVKYKELLNTYPASSIIPIHELDTEVLISITE